MVIGEVVNVHIDDAVIVNGMVDMSRIRADRRGSAIAATMRWSTIFSKCRAFSEAAHHQGCHARSA